MTRLSWFVSDLKTLHCQRLLLEFTTPCSMNTFFWQLHLIKRWCYCHIIQESLDESWSALSKALRLLTHLDVLAPFAGFNCRVIHFSTLFLFGTLYCCCLVIETGILEKVFWSVNLLVTFLRAVLQNPALPGWSSCVLQLSDFSGCIWLFLSRL